MVMNSSSALDNLSANGIINFDANAFIKGEPAKYVAPTAEYLPFDQPLNVLGSTPPYGGPVLKRQPQHDAFVNKSEDNENQPAAHNWKKAATAVLVATLAVWGGVKCKSKISSLINKINTSFSGSTGASANGAGTKTKSSAANIAAKAKALISSAAGQFNALPKGAKIASGAAAGVLAILGIKKAFSGHKPAEAAAQPQVYQPEVAV